MSSQQQINLTMRRAAARDWPLRTKVRLKDGHLGTVVGHEGLHSVHHAPLIVAPDNPRPGDRVSLNLWPQDLERVS